MIMGMITWTYGQIDTLLLVLEVLAISSRLYYIYAEKKDDLRFPRLDLSKYPSHNFTAAAAATTRARREGTFDLIAEHCEWRTAARV